MALEHLSSCNWYTGCWSILQVGACKPGHWSVLPVAVGKQGIGESYKLEPPSFGAENIDVHFIERQILRNVRWFFVSEGFPPKNLCLLFLLLCIIE